VIISRRDATRKLAAELGAWLREMDKARPPAPAPPPRRQQRRDERALRSLGYLD
jgi:hypothetical protein